MTGWEDFSKIFNNRMDAAEDCIHPACDEDALPDQFCCRPHLVELRTEARLVTPWLIGVDWLLWECSLPVDLPEFPDDDA